MTEIHSPQVTTRHRQPYALGLIGYPLGHSLSPQIHAAALHELNLSGEYGLYPIPPDENGLHQLKELLAQICSGEIHGLNVTIPYKQTIMPLLDELAPAAAAIGAVNTIFLQNGVLIGDNTDAPGFWADLEKWKMESGPWEEKKALVLGAGGSARAVVYALLEQGFDITLAARRVEQAEKIGWQLAVDGCSLKISSLAAVFSKNSPNYLPPPTHHQLIINTTPLGMHPHPAASPWPEEVPFPKNAAVYDLVYNPRETQLVQQARVAGIPATTGLGMLIEQAALAFERWTGLEAPRAAMREAVE